ncbi:MAG TPA: hypothetical protein VF002_01535, partial [Gaiellaceae bacterium]
ATRLKQGPFRRPDELRAAWISALIGGVAALLLLVVVPRGGDAAAHLYRTFLVQRGALLWDNLWFAGQYPLASYSLVYYLLAAAVGNGLLAAVGVVLSALLFASLVLRAFPRAGRWPAYWFAALAGGQFFTGDYPYTVAFTALLATLWALQRGRTWLGIACAALTLGCSPLAFLFLCLVLLALRISSPQPHRRTLIIGASLLVLVGVEMGSLWLFPSHLSYPFAFWRFILGVSVCLLGAALALRSSAARPLASIFVIWTFALVAGYLIPSPVGHNLLRPATLVFPLMLLAAQLAGRRPRWLAYPAVAAAFAANVGPYVATVISRSDKASRASFWSPMLHYVAAHSSAGYRLEVVPTINHWEAYYIPKVGFPIARGWYQQLDSGDNPRLNHGGLTPRVYRDWLRSVGVRYVIVANATPASGAANEARLLLSGRSGLVRVFQSRNGRVYELPDANPILTGAASAAITRQSISGIVGWTSQAGPYFLRVHYTRLLQVEQGAVCLSPGPGGMTRLEARQPGRFALKAVEGAGAFLESILDSYGKSSPRCHASQYGFAG